MITARHVVATTMKTEAAFVLERTAHYRRFGCCAPVTKSNGSVKGPDRTALRRSGGISEDRMARRSVRGGKGCPADRCASVPQWLRADKLKSLITAKAATALS